LAKQEYSLELKYIITGIENPSYLQVSPRNNTFYVVSEVNHFENQGTGLVYSYLVNIENDKVVPINRKMTYGEEPCYITLDRNEKYIAVANYSGGNIAMFSIELDGSVGDLTDIVEHRGKSINRTRQDRPHPHCIAFDTNNEHLLVTDLGCDEIVVYGFAINSGKLQKNATQRTRVTPGSGPRHLAFHPSGDIVYVTNELNNSVLMFNYDKRFGRLDQLQELSAVPDTYKATNYAADIHVSSSGAHLYCSNRGHDSIAIYSIQYRSGLIENRCWISTHGKGPRNFLIDREEKLMLVANRDSNDISIFRIEGDAKLVFVGKKENVNRPACIKAFYIE
jgi:6-phosphogluconolactonase